VSAPFLAHERVLARRCCFTGGGSGQRRRHCRGTESERGQDAGKTHARWDVPIESCWRVGWRSCWTGGRPSYIPTTTSPMPVVSNRPSNSPRRLVAFAPSSPRGMRIVGPGRTELRCRRVCAWGAPAMVERGEGLGNPALRTPCIAEASCVSSAAVGHPVWSGPKLPVVGRSNPRR